jgi:hypothetical protein
MYLCDFFIHGTGGSAYEEVNDFFIEKVLGVKPPAFGTASATWLVDPKESEALDKVLSYGEKILAWERLLEKNPESLFNRVEAWKTELPSFMQPAFQSCLDDAKLAEKAAEKGRLLALLHNPAQKAQAAAKIKEINLFLSEGLTEALKAVEKGKLDIEQIQQSHEVLSFRQYPYFCYSPDAILELKTKVRDLIPPA